MKVDKIAEGIANYINKSKRTQEVLKGINRNPAVFGAAVSFCLASILRPATIGLLPFKNKNDKKTSQASAISAGLVELISTVSVFIPLNKAIEKTSKNLYKTTGSFYEGNNVALRQFKSVTNRGFKLGFLIPLSLARFALVKPLMNKLFAEKTDQVEERKLDKVV